MNSPVVIDYYTDILCVWAWIAQKRIDELNKALGNRIDIRYHYMDLFGDVHHKINSQWRDRGKFPGFAEHVINSAKPFEHAPVNLNIWQSIQPTTSANAHLYLKAVALAYNPEKSIAMALKFRQSFFVDNLDISCCTTLRKLLTQEELNIEKIDAVLDSGMAMAALMQEYQMAKQLALKGSPSFIVDNGRQTLYGNVGYRVLLANIEEQLKKPANEASWC